MLKLIYLNIFTLLFFIFYLTSKAEITVSEDVSQVSIGGYGGSNIPVSMYLC